MSIASAEEEGVGAQGGMGGMRYEVRTIGIWPLVKVSFFVNLVLGFLFIDITDDDL